LQPSANETLLADGILFLLESILWNRLGKNLRIKTKFGQI
jgi:hypothetical protein